MNIVILCYHRVGGSGIVAYEIGRAMAEEREHTVHFMGLEPPFRLKDNYSEAIRFHRVWIKDYPVFDFQPYSLALASQLSTIIQKYNIDVIHSHYAMPHAASAILARDIAGKPVKCVTTLHGTDITLVGAHPSMMNITRYAIENSDVVTAVSDNLRIESEKVLGITLGKIQTVYNFVNRQFFNPSLKPSGPVDKNGKTVLLHISNLRAVKAPLDVINIFHGILKKLNRPLELWVVGEGPFQCEMMLLAEKLGIEEKVQFLGVYNDVGPLIVSSSLMLLPSQQESFGLVALESMACGVPVIASNVGGLPELIEDGKNGFLFTKGNVDEAVEKSINLLKDRELYARFCDAALRTADEKFSQTCIIDQYEKLYMQ